MMLVLSRKCGQTIKVGGMEITVVRIKGGNVRLGFVGPENVVRGELGDVRAIEAEMVETGSEEKT